MPLMSQSAYAKHRGCARRAVQKAIAEGRIKLTTRGGKTGIDPAKADAAWAKNSDPSQAKKTKEQQQSGGGFQAARTDQITLRVERERLELDQMRGSLISLDAAKRMVFSAFRQVRDAVLNVPARIQDQCAAESDPFKVGAAIEAELVAALAGFNAARVLQAAGSDDEAD